jgi:predicted SnoaL-like aldol condensation-catalyzing enzyme
MKRTLLATLLALPLALPALAHDGSNKAIVSELSQALLDKTPLESLRHYFAQNLIQHDPQLADGREAMLSWIAGQRAQQPARTLSVKHVVADGDFVFVHAQLSATPGDEMTGQNRFDIYRLERGVVVERWSYAGAAPTRSANGNSAFNDGYRYNGPVPALAPERVQLHRQLARTLSEEVFGKRNFGMVDRFWSASYIQHNPWVANGRAALQAALPYVAPAGSAYRVVHALADGDLSLVCAQGHPPNAAVRDEFSGYAVCDLYRIVNLEMVEHWDVAQSVPATSANGHSMFSSLYRGNASGR